MAFRKRLRQVKLLHIRFSNRRNDKRTDFFLFRESFEPHVHFRQDIERILDNIQTKNPEDFLSMSPEDKVLYMVRELKEKWGYVETELLTYPIKTNAEGGLYVDYQMMGVERSYRLFGGGA